ncbi:methionyl-tRNA formyltransferase [Azospirillum brasilense]|uniref:Methionyl-tRNA formyltransferase n=1 Tax=Azospirillum brasilense TaxID=192 RepID=A0A0P0F7Z9_AZOBR|nr:MULTISPECIES: methionyl-tRNA formyltransferase [Azospirillum]ALJ36111.1 methionyl-tRNA formyltransferase [Azospirillum brasilense]MDW7552544.1 methionyl-tRNA formyltransferase [Azospirillum brasilense]MDW7592265.1 methionyl-tRNA formyltransferase [Azospirillum brasilense]MDW7627395.1 methionyl-tRNA formyltransferase [Azospirillum brasilense]MDX5954916.1 methionyl-tRNA formyltransferase [Azospirillum brasilense]
MTPLRLVFMGTPDFAVPSLRALADAGHEVVCVYSQPPRPAGRGQQVQKSPVHRFAEERGIPVRTPKSLRNAEAQAEFAELKADAAVVAAYGLILPQPILDAPRLGCLNVHGSLLPRWRGAAPIQRAILAGDAETGITIMQMDIGLDTGAMLLKDAVPITAGTTASSLHDALADMGARLIVEALDGLAAGRLTAEPQPEAGVTYAAKLTREDGRLDWTRDAASVERQVRALTPWPGCWFDAPTPTGGVERIKVLKAELAPDPRKAAPGTLLDDRLTIACADGGVRLTLVQRPGKAPVDGAALLRGFALPVGTRLGDAACSAGN